MTPTQKIKAKLASLEDLYKQHEVCSKSFEALNLAAVQISIPSLLATISDLIGSMEKLAASRTQVEHDGSGGTWTRYELIDVQAIARAALERAEENLK